MKLLIDMNLSPSWVEVLSAAEGINAVHWSTIGTKTASDREIMSWAESNGHIVLTHDLDFGAMLAATGADSPSVLQLRFQDVSPEKSERLVLDVLRVSKKSLKEAL